MDFRKNAGIVLVFLGMILTMDRTKDFQGIVSTIAYYIKGYWPLILCFIGMYIITTPKKKKNKISIIKSTNFFIFKAFLFDYYR